MKDYIQAIIIAMRLGALIFTLLFAYETIRNKKCRDDETDNSATKPKTEFFTILITGTICCILVINIFRIASGFVFLMDPYVFNYDYEYENITLSTVVAIDPKLAEETLLQAKENIEMSALYDNNQAYIVKFPNRKRFKYIYFSRNIGNYILEQLIPKQLEGRNIIMMRVEVTGYVDVKNPKLTAYIAYLSPHTIAHELTHQMVFSNIPYFDRGKSVLTHRKLHEAYAQYITFDRDNSKGHAEEFLCRSKMCREEHEDKEFCFHFTGFMDEKNYYDVDDYSYLNAVNMKMNLDQGKNIVDLVTSKDEKISEKELEGLYYKQLEELGFIKADDTDLLAGEWRNWDCLRNSFLHSSWHTQEPKRRP